jgi:hypothetical protein
MSVRCLVVKFNRQCAKEARWALSSGRIETAATRRPFRASSGQIIGAQARSRQPALGARLSLSFAHPQSTRLAPRSCRLRNSRAFFADQVLDLQAPERDAAARFEQTGNRAPGGFPIKSPARPERAWQPACPAGQSRPPLRTLPYPAGRPADFLPRTRRSPAWSCPVQPFCCSAASRPRPRVLRSRQRGAERTAT